MEKQDQDKRCRGTASNKVTHAALVNLFQQSSNDVIANGFVRFELSVTCPRFSINKEQTPLSRHLEASH